MSLSFIVIGIYRMFCKWTGVAQFQASGLWANEYMRDGVLAIECMVGVKHTPTRIIIN